MYGSDPFVMEPSTSASTPSRVAAAEATEDRFFEALLAGDATRLAHVITADFAIVDVFSGAVTDRGSFLEAFRRGLLTFSRLELIERFTRHYGDVAIIVGRTEMAGAYGGTSFTAASRYTHVLVLGSDRRWRLANAQGTTISDT
jgi:ketosteroid isomerase-like protein